jgi:maltokinase
VPGDLARRVAQTDPRLLVPSGAVAPDRLTVVDSWTLPAGGPPLILALAEDAEGRWHVLPLVDDVHGLRRAREGDGWATAALEVVTAPPSASSPSADGGFQVRVASPDGAPQLGGIVSEVTVESSPVHEVVLVGDALRVRLDLRPGEASGSPIDVIEHVKASGFMTMGGLVGDIVWTDAGHWVAPIVGVAEPLVGVPLDEALGRAAARHLRGGEDPEPTLVLARGLALLLAHLHIALATPSAVIPEPLRQLTDAGAAAMSRAARDAVAEAVVLTDPDTQQHVRSRRHAMRSAFDALSGAAGTTLIPAAPFESLGQAHLADDTALILDPLQLTSAGQPRPAVADVAALLRAVNHVAHGAWRRLVGGGESVPVERVLTWSSAVRELLLAEYREALAAAGRTDLFDDRLLLGLEIEAECRALSYAARTLSTWSTVPDAGLLELLPPD